MTVLVEHDNGIKGRRGVSEDTITTLEDCSHLFKIIYKLGAAFISWKSCRIEKERAGFEPTQLRLRRSSSKTS